MPAAAEHGQPAAAEHGRTSLQRYMRTFGFGEPLEIRDGKTMLHYLARQSEVAAEGNTVLAAWFELLQVYCLRRPASWLEFAILVEAPRLPVGWTALDILANSYADVAPRMVQQLLEAGAELSPRSRARSTRPLHAALRNGNGEVVDILLAAKADPHARTQLGFSCADLAPTPTLKELFRNLGVGADETDPDPAPPSRAKPAPPRAPSSYGAQPATPPPPPPTSSRDAAPSQQAATSQQIGNRPHDDRMRELGGGDPEREWWMRELDGVWWTRLGPKHGWYVWEGNNYGASAADEDWDPGRDPAGRGRRVCGPWGPARVCRPCPMCGQRCTGHPQNPYGNACTHALEGMNLHEWES